MSTDAEVYNIVNSLSSHPILLFIHVSGVTLLIIDWLFTLDIELVNAWGGVWNKGRTLYFLTRYSAFFDAPIMLYYNMAVSVPPLLCARLYLVASTLSIFGIVVAELIMTIRVWALWGRRRDIGIVLITAAFVNGMAAIVIYSIRQSSQYVVMGHLSSAIPGCFPIAMTDFTTAWPFVPLATHQTIVFLLTAVKGIQHYRNRVYGSSLIDTFYRDGITYYALLFALSIANIAATPQFHTAAPSFLTSLQRTAHSILSARMLLHLRQGFQQPNSREDQARISIAIVLVGLGRK
ncbi:hypothetical protein BDZ94DRAFT_388314 [Collybia nuda]|uniref:DUF6533 domain-containing protein n=1 Tax=Collybia nuda TaxID=64659 RepID=A0A9P5YAT2_9AGAR|nr:hypothetical protein BDZ94DRAFT_388314 [Collybia nuda]